jgi:hypothetical protein
MFGIGRTLCLFETKVQKHLVAGIGIGVDGFCEHAA